MRRIRFLTILAAAAVLALGTAAPATSAGTVTLRGHFTTATTSGGIVYTALRTIPGGSEGKYRIAGVKHPGSLYAAAPEGTGLAWYYGVSGIAAGNALITLQPDGSYRGSIWFYDRKGNVVDSGRVHVVFP